MKPWLASVGAVVAGFIVTALASTAADAVMHAADIFPSAPQLMSDSLFALAAAYRALFTVVGGYVTARLAPDRPMRHAWILAGIGLVAGLAGVVAYYTIGGAELGPPWYAISIPVEAIPCVWLGGRQPPRVMNQSQLNEDCGKSRGRPIMARSPALAWQSHPR